MENSKSISLWIWSRTSLTAITCFCISLHLENTEDAICWPQPVYQDQIEDTVWALWGHSLWGHRCWKWAADKQQTIMLWFIRCCSPLKPFPWRCGQSIWDVMASLYLSVLRWLSKAGGGAVRCACVCMGGLLRSRPSEPEPTVPWCLRKARVAEACY